MHKCKALCPGGGAGPGGEGGVEGESVTRAGVSEEDRLLEEKEAKAIASILNAGPIASRDATALFGFARRVKAGAPFSG